MSAITDAVPFQNRPAKTAPLNPDYILIPTEIYSIFIVADRTLLTMTAEYLTRFGSWVENALL